MRGLSRLPALACVAVLGGCVSPAGSAAPASRGLGYVERGEGVRLHYRIVGGPGDTLVVVHGGPVTDHAYLRRDLGPLAARHVLLFYDQRGTGRSTPVSELASLSVAAHVADLDAVRRHFRLERMTLLGHSWGALLGAAYAREHPDRVAALIALSPGPLRRDPYFDQLIPRVTAWMDSTTLAELAARDAARRDPARDARATCRSFFELLLRGALADPTDVAMARHIAAGFCSAPAPTLRHQMRVDSLTMESLGAYDWRERFRRTRVPVLVIAGARDVDPAAAYREWVEAFPDARMVRLEGAGHFSFVERPEAFVAAVTTFLRQVRPAPGP